MLGEFDSDSGSILSVVRELKEIKNLIPVSLREFAIDGTFERGVENEEKEDTSA